MSQLVWGQNEKCNKCGKIYPDNYSVRIYRTDSYATECLFCFTINYNLMINNYNYTQYSCFGSPIHAFRNRVANKQKISSKYITFIYREFNFDKLFEINYWYINNRSPDFPDVRIAFRDYIIPKPKLSPKKYDIVFEFGYSDS